MHVVAEALAVEAAVGVVHEAGGGGVGGAGGGGHHRRAVGGVVHVVGQSKRVVSQLRRELLHGVAHGVSRAACLKGLMKDTFYRL